MSHDERRETAASIRRRGLVADPVVPLVVLGGGAFAGVALSRSWLVWLGLAGVAGYALSGSV